MKIKCPSCHAEHSLEAVLDGQAGSELMLLLADLEPGLARLLLSYLSLFRSPSRALSWDRALRLGREALALEAQRGRLAAALSKTITVLREKQKGGEGWKPLTSHNYLARVLKEMPPDAPGALMVPPGNPENQKQPPVKLSKTAQAMIRLESRKSDRRG